MLYHTYWKALLLLTLTVWAISPSGQSFRRANDARMEKMRGTPVVKTHVHDSIPSQGVFLENYALESKAER